MCDNKIKKRTFEKVCLGFDQFMLILFDIHNVNVFIFCEGQKISEGNFGVFNYPKKTKIFT